MTIESKRLALQAALDRQKDEQRDQKDKAVRNTLGQFATPSGLASDVIEYALKVFEGDSIKFLDPAFGTGSFYSALLNHSESFEIATAVGIEVDDFYGEPTRELWQDYDLSIKAADFTKLTPPKNIAKANLLICNPPYVRHHHIAKENKKRLCESSTRIFGIKVSGLAGLYCHFIAAAHDWMAKGAIAGWLIPSEFMDVNYGAALKAYLTTKVTLLAVHRYDPSEQLFGDAQVSSAIVWIKNEPPLSEHRAIFSFGGSLNNPSISKLISVKNLKIVLKWTVFPVKEAKNEEKVKKQSKILDYFRVRRGLATGNNDFFIMGTNKAKSLDIPFEFLKPILPSPKHLKEQVIECDEFGLPKIDSQLYLLDCTLEPQQIEQDHPSLWAYLNEGIKLGVNQAYLCKNRRLWYRQDRRQAAPFYCTYIGRKTKASDKPFSFVLNHSEAVVSNSYLALEPLPEYKELLANDSDLRVKVWQALNAICGEQMKAQGRVYGGGLYKMEPKELSNVPATLVAKLL